MADSVQTAEHEFIARRILEAIEGLRYGAVEVVVHDGRVVQIERKEKVRFDQPKPR